MEINVVAALIKKNKKILIAKRSTGDPNLLGKWEFPGGKVKENESEEQALEREIKEELCITINAKKFLTNNIHKYPSKTINLKLYNCEYISGKIVLHDHLEYKWIDKKELLDYDLAPADIKLAKNVMEMKI